MIEDVRVRELALGSGYIVRSLGVTIVEPRGMSRRADSRCGEGEPASVSLLPEPAASALMMTAR